MTTYTDTQLDALRELANIGSGTASTALSQMLGRPTDISVPTVAALPLPEALAVAGAPDTVRHGIVVPIVGDMPAMVVLLIPGADVAALCGLYGLDPDTEDGRSMLGEVGNILGTSYINVLAQMVGMAMEPAPPQVITGKVGAILSSVLLGDGQDADTALVMDSALEVEGMACAISFLLIPRHSGIDELLSRLGL